ncbi:MAG: hypothetical protein COA85_13410 [Robiginitomaculum sp.]|nr:MAG: hypothetical protein COA85_13410 [Robiginitomaculum sp.]
MLKKSLIALAIAGAAISGITNAATLAVTGKTVSLEGNLNANLGNSILAAADANAVTITTGTAYIVNDLVTVTVSGAKYDKTITPTLVPAAGTTVYSFVDFSDDNTVRFRVTVADEASARVLTFAAWSLKTAGAVNKTDVKFASTAISTNSLIGSYDAAATDIAFSFKNQLSTTLTKLNGEVSTGNGRAEFTTNANQDVLTIANVDNAGVDALTIAKAVHVITGDFGWMIDYDATANSGNANGTLDVAELAVAITNAGCTSGVATMNSTLTSLTMTDTGVIAASCAIKLNNVGNAAGGSAITAPQSFTVTSTYTNAGGQAINVAAGSAGAFTLDGSTTNIPFLPFGSDYAQSITVTNTGSVVGAITVDIYYMGTKYTKTLTATSAAKSVTDISTEIAAFAAASGVTGNAQVTVVVNAPGIVTKALYYHKPTQDRVLTK